MGNYKPVILALLLVFLFFMPTATMFQNDTSHDAVTYPSDDASMLANEQRVETTPHKDGPQNAEAPTVDKSEVNVGGERSGRKFLDAFKLNFDPWDPEAGETVKCSAIVHNSGTEGQIAYNVNVEFYFDDEFISTGMIDEIQPGDNGTACVKWKAVYGSHNMRIIADPDGSDGGPDEYEVLLNVTQSTYSVSLGLERNASWIKNSQTNYYYLKVTNQGSNFDTFDLSFRTTKYGEDPTGWTVELEEAQASLDTGESTYVRLEVSYQKIIPDYTAEVVAKVKAQSRGDSDRSGVVYTTTNVIHDKPILFVDDDGQHKYKGEDDPMLPGHFILKDGTWGGSYGAESDYLMNYSLDVNYEGMWDYVNLPGDSKYGRWANASTMGRSGPVFNSQTVGYNQADYPYEDESGNDIFLENYDVVIWNLGYSECLTSDPGGDDEPKSNNDDWWDQNETAKYLKAGGNLWLTGNAISFYFDRYATIEGEVTNQWLRDYFHVDKCVHAEGLKPQIVGVTMDPIGKGINTVNGYFYGNKVVGAERGNVATDWTPMEDAHGVIYGKGKNYSTVRYEHLWESTSNQRFKTVLQSGGFENFGDWDVLDEPMRIKLVENMLTWLGVPRRNAPEYDVGVFRLNRPLESYIEPGNSVPIDFTLKNFGQKDITNSFEVIFKVEEVGGSLQYQRTEAVSEDIPVGGTLDVGALWASNRPQEGKDYRISITIEDLSPSDGDPGNDEGSVVKTAHSIVDIGIGRIWQDWENPWNAAMIGYDTTFHAKIQNLGSTEETFDVDAVIWSPLSTIVYEETTSVSLVPGYSTTLDWSWTPRNPGGLISGYGGNDGDVSNPYILNISVSASGDNVSGNDGKDLEVVVMAFFDASEPRYMLEDWTSVDLSDHDNHGNDDEKTPWHLTKDWYMSESHAWKASNSLGQLKSDWNTCIISPKISLKNFTDTRINNVHSGQPGGSCYLELSLDYDGNQFHVEDASWTQIWSKSYQAQGVWMLGDPANLNDYLDKEVYLRYRLTTSEDNDVGWYADDLVITGVVKNYNTNDIGVSMVSIEPLIDQKEIPRNIDVTIENFGENKTNSDGRPGFDVELTIEDGEGQEVYNESTSVNEVLGIGGSCTVSFNTSNGKEWLPVENGLYRIHARTIWEKDAKNIDDVPHNDVMVIDGVVQYKFFSDDMESGENEWKTDGDTDCWALGTPTKGPPPHSGSNCWGTNLDGNYPDLEGNSVNLEHYVDLKIAMDPVLSFWYWLEIEAHDYDTVYVEVRTVEQSKYTILWQNPIPGRQGVPYRTDGWRSLTLDLEDFAYSEVYVRFRLETDGDVNYPGWYIDDLWIGGTTPPMHDARVVSIDYPAGNEYIAPGETIEILATVMNVGLNEEVIPVKAKAIRQGASPITHELEDQSTGLLRPGEKVQVKFNWQLPIGAYQYRIEVRTELENDGNSRNDELYEYIWAREVFDISILSLYADPMVQDVARTRSVVAEVKNVGNTILQDNVEITFEAIFDGTKEDEYATTISIARDEIVEVRWEWQSFKYGEYTIEVEGTILWESESNMDDNNATLEDIITVVTIFSDTREMGDSPYYLDHSSGEFKIWDPAEMGEVFWTGDNESDPSNAGWHTDNIGHFSRRSWYGGIPDNGNYGNNMEAHLTSQALNLEGFVNVRLSFYTKYILEGSANDHVEISISNDVDNDDSWERLLMFPDEDESHDSAMETGNRYGWLYKDIRIPDIYLQDTFYMRILLKTDNDITYRGVWIDDIALYGTNSGNHPPVARFSANHNDENFSYSRNVIGNPPIDLLDIEGKYIFNNLPNPVGGEQDSFQLGVSIQFEAGLSFDPDAGDDDISYRWDFGDGGIAYGKSVTHTYTEYLPLEGYFIVTLKVTDDQGAYTEDTMIVWIGNKPPEADYIVTPYFDTVTPIDDSNDGVENGIIDVFYGDRIIFQQQSTDPEDDPLTFEWGFRCIPTGYPISAVGDTVSGVVGQDFLYEGLDGSIPIIPVRSIYYNVTIFVSDKVSTSEISYNIRVHPYATADFAKQVKLGASILEASVTLTWRGFPDEAAPQASYISPDRPVFVHIDEKVPSPDPNLHNRGGIGPVYDIRAVGCRLQDGEEGFIEAGVSVPILTSDLEDIGDAFSLQDDLRLEVWDEVVKRFIVVEGSHVIAQAGVKYVVGTVDHFSLFTAIVDSVYNDSNPNYYKMVPDLSVFRIEFSRSPVLNGQEIEVRATIKNTGRTHARNVDVNFYDGGDLIGEETIDVVRASGDTVLVKSTFTVTMIDPYSLYENHIIKVHVNEQRSIDEGPQNYKNNEGQELLVAVSPINQSPTPRITTPKDGATVKGYIMIKGNIPDDDTEIGKVYQPFGNNDMALLIEKVDPSPISVYSTNYILVDRKDAYVAGGQGRVKDIYGLNFDDESTDISYYDNDRDGNISAGDVFLVKKAYNGGLAEEGYSLELEFGKVDKVEISIDDREWITVTGTDSWSYEWDTTEVKERKYSIKVRSFDGSAYSETRKITIRVSTEDGKTDSLFDEIGSVTFIGIICIIAIVGLFGFATLKKKIEEANSASQPSIPGQLSSTPPPPQPAQYPQMCFQYQRPPRPPMYQQNQPSQYAPPQKIGRQPLQPLRYPSARPPVFPPPPTGIPVRSDASLVCPQCGNMAEEKHVFCMRCGYRRKK